MKRGLVGYTGTVGKNLLNQVYISNLYNSSNIENIKNEHFDELILSCLPATKWMINKNPEIDDKNIDNLINILKTVSAKFIIVISTIDVYPIKDNKSNEDTIINIMDCDTYGKNRLKFERFIIEHFQNYLIVRLPGLFGDYLKKNIIYDLINNNNINNINNKSIFQWYFMDNLYNDILKFKNKNYQIVNLFTEPIITEEIVNLFFSDKKNILSNNINSIKYNLQTKYSESNYFYTKEQILNELKIYIDKCNLKIKNMDNVIFSNIAWNNIELKQVMNILKENNISKVELALTKFYNWDDITRDKLIELRKIFNDNGFDIYSLQSITFGLNYNIFNETRNLLLEHLSNVIKYANILGCKKIVFGSPKNRSNNIIDENIAFDFFRELNKVAVENNIIVCIEPNARIYNCNFLWNLEQTYNFVSKLNCSHIKMMIDTGCMSFENDDIHDIIKYKNQINHIHLSEQYLNILSNKYTNHKDLCKILIELNMKNFTIEMKENENNINSIYKTINFIKNNYDDIFII